VVDRGRIGCCTLLLHWVVELARLDLVIPCLQNPLRVSPTVAPVVTWIAGGVEAVCSPCRDFSGLATSNGPT
jgi:hypothetical protein